MRVHANVIGGLRRIRTQSRRDPGFVIRFRRRGAGLLQKSWCSDLSAVASAAPSPLFRDMPVELNHTIVHSRDADASARFLAETLGLPPPRRFGPFVVVDVHNGVSLDFLTTDEPFIIEHYAFLVSETEFDEIFSRLSERGQDYWADPRLARKGEINRNDGGRGLYFKDPSGHYLEIITRPYGSGG
jgi:extradiol dioxygenase family protein